MRLAVCALSAVLLSGCSWLGMGGHSGSSYGNSGVYGANCGAGYGAGQGFGVQGYGGQGGGGCGAAGGYGVAGGGVDGFGAGAGYGQAGFGQAGYGQGAGFGQAGYGQGAGFGQAGYGQGVGGAMGAGYGQGAGQMAGMGAGGYGYGQGFGGDPRVGFGGAYGTGIYGQGGAMGGAYGSAGSVTTLGANAPFGAAVGGQQIGATQYAGGAYGGNVTTVQGNPIYVQQPYPSYYGVPQLRAVSGGGFGGALPFGFEAGVGTDFFIDGDFVTAKDAGIATGGTLHVSATDAISYKDAFDNGVGYDLATTYDLNQSTTLLGRVGYNKADGQRLLTGTVNDGTDTENLYAEFSDLEQVTLEGGIRKYVGGWNNPVSGMRPYVGATAGFTHTDSITISQDAGALLPAGSNVQQYVDGGWTPTASGVVGAEWQVGGRTALGLETGIRWSDDLNTLGKTDDAFSIPVRLRGRVSF